MCEEASHEQSAHSDPTKSKSYGIAEFFSLHVFGFFCKFLSNCKLWYDRNFWILWGLHEQSAFEANKEHPYFWIYLIELETIDIFKVVAWLFLNFTEKLILADSTY